MGIFFQKKDKVNTYFAAAASALASLLIIGTIVFHRLEDWTWIQSFYFTVVTLATVGYGDLHPTSDASRLFAAFFILFGVSVGIASISFIGSQYLAKREEMLIRKRERENQNQKNTEVEEKINKF